MKGVTLLLRAWGLGLAAMIAAARADLAPTRVGVGLGIGEVFSGEDREVLYSTELVFADLGKGFAPVAQASLGGEDQVFVGAGVAWGAESRTGWGVRVGLVPGVYDRGEGKDLGGHFQVMSFVEGTYRFTERQRAGLRLAHVSNASTRSDNPGTETVAATYSLALR